MKTNSDKKMTAKKAFTIAGILMATAVVFLTVAVNCEGAWLSAGTALSLLALVATAAFVLWGAYLTPNKRKAKAAAQSKSAQESEKYHKMFPHMTTDEHSTDDEKETDDFLIMDMFDDGDDDL